MDNYSEALDYFNRSIELDSTDSNISFSEGNKLFFLNQKEKALEYFHKAILLNQDILNNPIPSYLQGQILIFNNLILIIISFKI